MKIRGAVKLDKLKNAAKHIDIALELLEGYAKELNDSRDIAKLESLLWKLLEVRFELAIIKNTLSRRAQHSSYTKRKVKL